MVAQLIDVVKGGQNLGSELKLDFNTHREQVILMKDFYDRQAGPLKPTNDEDSLDIFARVIIADRSQVMTRQHLRDTLSPTEMKDL